MSRQRWLIAIMVVGIMAVVGLWVFGSWMTPGTPPAAADLAAYPEIDLGPLAGADAHIGVTRSEYLPILVTKGGRGKTSLAVLDAHLGTLTDAGPIPADGWVVNAYPRASDRFVAISHWVCPDKPVEGDAGLECHARHGTTDAVQLSVYDLETARWSTISLPEFPDSWLADINEGTAVLRHRPSMSDEPDLWATVDLTEPLEVTGFATDRPASPAAAWPTRPATREITDAPLRSLHGAGRCLVIGSHKPITSTTCICCAPHEPQRGCSIRVYPLGYPDTPSGIPTPVRQP